MAEPRELRLAVAMNGGISLAVWIGGVAMELQAFVESNGTWAAARSRSEITTARVDVLAGTSAGGLNAVFLALAQAYNDVDLGALRAMWLDLADFDGALLRDPSMRDPSSLLDGDYFHDNLLSAIHALVANKARSERPVDLLTTATAVHGEVDDVRDDFGDTFPNNRHEVLFHFSGRFGNSGDFVRVGTSNDRFVRQLALASRASASFPFAFEPWFCDPTDDDVFAEAERRRVNIPHARFLMDGGVLNNLPVDRAIDAVFELPAEGRVERVLAAVVPLHTRPGEHDPRRKGDRRGDRPKVGPTLSAAALGIPRDENDAAALRLVGENNDAVDANRSARHALYSQPFQHVVDASDALWESYRARAGEQSLRSALKTCAEYLATCECIALAPELDALRDAAAGAQIAPDDFGGWPWLPTHLVSQHVWSPPAIRRAAAIVLDLTTLARDAGCKYSDLADVKHLAHDAITRSTLAYSARPGAMVGILLGEKLSRLAPPPGSLLDALRSVFEERERNGETRRSLQAAFDNLGAAVDKLHTAWNTLGRGVPHVLDTAMGGDVPDRTERGRELVARLEVLQSSFAGMADPSEQKLKLAMVSPSLRAPIDPQGRVDPKEKLSGDEMAHFGAFLNRSWRANDWLWGRLDGATALGAILDLGDDVVEARQREIVGEEAFYVCDAVVRDTRRGARCAAGRALFVDGVPDEQRWPRDQSALDWDDMAPFVGTDDPVAFVGRLAIGAEAATSEFSTKRGRRLLARAAGTSTGVLINAGLPKQRMLNVLLRPARAVTRLARLIFR